MTDRMARLKAHVEACSGPPVIGVDDCGPWVARWIEIETGKKVDFPKYATPQEAYALAAAVGGLVNLVEPLLANIPLWRIETPVYGDVGIIRLSDRETAAIFLDNGLAAVRGERGKVFFFHPRPASILRAWELPAR